MSSLPPELLQVLNQAYFLHVLATDPAKVVEPGKSLLSVMARATPALEPSPLHAEVRKVVHNAFWDEALLSLSSMSPSVQLPRLKFLYKDLQEALVPLFPPDHAILQTLAAPLPPTSSPLHSTIALLNDILTALRQRCAPVRDPDIDTLLADLASPPESSQNMLSPGVLTENPLAILIISTIRSMIGLTDTLKRDLTNTLFGAMSETQLAGVIRQQARAREREIILGSGMWGGVKGKNGVEVVTAEWTTWLGSQTGDAAWSPRLLRAVASPIPITCRPFNTDSNALPPQLFFSRPVLFRVQNYLQAFVVVASLKSLVRIPPYSPPSPATIPSTPDFVPRIWSLLQSEIDLDDYSLRKTDADTEPVTYHTKLIHLADEVVRAQKLFLSSGSFLLEAEERELRTAVERTLRLEDPVFALLQGRLMRAIGQRIEENLNSSSHETGTNGNRLPEKMRTGRETIGAEQLTLVNSIRGSAHKKPLKPIAVKGFEDEVLEKEIGKVITTVLESILWVENIWRDTISKRSRPTS